jgi:hypothetical protein
MLNDFVSSLSNTQIQVIGPELIFGSLYDKIAYGRIKSEMFRHLVISRLFSPDSKLKTLDFLYRYQGITYSSDKIYRFLDTLCGKQKGKEEESPSEIKTIVEKVSFEQTKHVLHGKIKVAFYDMTRLYFEASDEDDLRKTGFSKDGKHHCPQIFLGLLVACEGNPIGYEIFEGNIFEGHICICFTAYTILLEIERMLKRAKSEITVKRAQVRPSAILATAAVMLYSKPLFSINCLHIRHITPHREQDIQSHFLFDHPCHPWGIGIFSLCRVLASSYLPSFLRAIACMIIGRSRLASRSLSSLVIIYFVVYLCY